MTLRPIGGVAVGGRPVLPPFAEQQWRLTAPSACVAAVLHVALFSFIYFGKYPGLAREAFFADEPALVLRGLSSDGGTRAELLADRRDAVRYFLIRTRHYTCDSSWQQLVEWGGARPR